MRPFIALLLLSCVVTQTLAVSSSFYRDSGYVNGTTGKDHLFHWLVRTADGNDSAPLVLWLQGGPGCAGTMGMFSENGPFTVNDSLELVDNPNAWTAHYNMLYIDSPVGSGFSYSDTTPPPAVMDPNQVTLNLVAALTDIISNLYPDLKGNPFFIMGESYAGKYIPRLAKYLRDNPLEGLPLTGIAIGDAWSDPPTQSQRFDSFAYETGLVGAVVRDQLRDLQKKVAAALEAEQWLEANALYGNVTTLMLTASGWPDPSDIRKYGFASLDFSNIIKFVNQESIRDLLHVGDHTFSEICASAVGQQLEADMMQSTAPEVVTLLNEGVPCLFYNGNFDPTVPPTSMESFLDSLAWTGQAGYLNADRVVWSVGTPPMGTTRGTVQAYGALTHALVAMAGHMAVEDQPVATLQMVNSFIAGQPIA